MGNKDVEMSASVSNRMLERPVKNMKSGLFDSGSDISQSLIDLRNTVEKLDPAKQGDLFAPRKLLGLIPFGNRLVGAHDGIGEEEFGRKLRQARAISGHDGDLSWSE